MVGSSKGEARKQKAKKALDVKEATKTKEEKFLALKALSLQVNKDAGREVLFIAGDREGFGVPDRIPSNIFSVDRLMGGGLPKGRFTEFFGGESVGKTTLALRFIAEAQKRGEVAAYIDLEWAFSRNWAITLGVNVDELILVSPTTCEEGLGMVRKLAKEGIADICVVDSVVALATVGEAGRELTDESIGVMARKLSQFFRMATSEVARANMAVVMVNQVRTAIGEYGNPEQAPGGNALKHYKSLSVLMRKGSTGPRDESIFWTKSEGDWEQIGFPMTFKVMKSKVGGEVGVSTPSSEARVDFYFDTGYDIKSDVVDTALRLEIPELKKAGAGWFTFERPGSSPVKVQGKVSLIDSLGEEDISFLEERIEAMHHEPKEIKNV
jgi:recombination protein RecA